jgi:hypothetical protein
VLWEVMKWNSMIGKLQITAELIANHWVRQRSDHEVRTKMQCNRQLHQRIRKPDAPLWHWSTSSNLNQILSNSNTCRITSINLLWRPCSSDLEDCFLLSDYQAYPCSLLGPISKQFCSVFWHMPQPSSAS